MVFFFFKQKTAYEMRISDWSSDVCSSDLDEVVGGEHRKQDERRQDAEGDPEDGGEADAHEHAGRVDHVPFGVAPQDEGEEQAEIGRATCRERVCQCV